MNSRTVLSILVASQILSVACLAVESVTRAEEGPIEAKHQVTGLFSKDRVEDLQAALEKLPGIALKNIDYERAEITVVYDVKEVFNNAKPEQIVERFHNLLGQPTRYTFGIKPLCTTPREEMELIEIPVAGLDCKGCCLGAYDAIYKIEGVEQATASFREGLVTAWVHQGTTTREELEKALEQRGVTLVKPPVEGETEAK